MIVHFCESVTAMKIISITVLFVCLSSGYHYEQTEPTTISPETLVKRYQMECIEETRVDPDIIVSLKNGKWYWKWMKMQVVKQWALCVLMKNQVMTKEGVFKIDVALSRIPLLERDFVEAQIDKCLTPKAVPAYDIAITYIKCFQKEKSNYSSLVSAFTDCLVC